MSAFVKSPKEGETAPTFWVRRVEGVRIKGASGAEETGTRGLALMIAVTSANNESAWSGSLIRALNLGYMV